MITLNTLNSLTAKDLSEQAKKLGIPGWRSMKKDDLVKALLKIARQKDREKAKASPATNGHPKMTVTKSLNGKSLNGKSEAPTSRIKETNRLVSSGKMQPVKTPNIRPVEKNGVLKKKAEPAPEAKPSPSPIAQKLREDRERSENLKNLALINLLDREQKVPEKDRLVLVVRDSFWVQAYWEITKSTVERARVALEGHWHSAQPVLRLLQIQAEGNTNTTETLVEQIPIHGGVKNWFIHLKETGKPYRIAIGYTTADGRFFLICKSNQISTPVSGVRAKDENWIDLTNDVEKYFALSGGFDENTQSGDLQAVLEEKSRHPIHAPAFERLGSGINGHSSEFAFHVDAHMIVHGKTNPNGSVTISGEPVRLQKDGTFSVKVDMPDRRQVLPIIASSRDGTQQRTTVLAIERNTKVMEPLTNDCDTD